MDIRDINIQELNAAHYNPRKDLQPGDAEYIKLYNSIEEFGYIDPIIWNEATGRVVGGHQRLKILQAKGLTKVKVSVVNLTEEKEKALNVALNKISGDWDEAKLAELLNDLTWADQELTGFTQEEIDKIIGNNAEVDIEEVKKQLKDRFIIPPFSILDARAGHWQQRKKEWLSLGIKSEEGRTREKTKADTGGTLFKSTTTNPDFYTQKTEVEKLLGRELTTKEFTEEYYKPPTEGFEAGTSVFDPVLTEIIYRWFNVEGGSILDPFAGGSVRGLVASILGYKYTGIELRHEQVEANKSQLHIADEPKPNWIIGDSLNIKTLAEGQYDLFFTCPPYADLEVYSDDPNDLSNMEYSDFVKTYREIIKRSVEMLKDNRFAVIVVGEVRDKSGLYRNFINYTTQAFIDAGMHYYNEAILITAVGSLPIRISRQFTTSRKVGKTHQNVLVFHKGDIEETKRIFKRQAETLQFEKSHENVLIFYKGDPREIKNEYPQDIEVSDLSIEIETK